MSIDLSKFKVVYDSKVLYAFAFVVFWFNYDLRVVFCVGFRNFSKN